MKRISIVLGAAAVFSLPAFAQTDKESAELAAAQRANLITSVQAELGIPVDGKMGPATHDAIGEFQRSKGLDDTGQLDKETITALGLGGPKPSAAAGASAHMQGTPSTPIGIKQPSEERAAEPVIKPEKPTGE